MTQSDPADLSAIEARHLIGSRSLSPVELAEACLRRLDAVNPALNAVVAHDPERLGAAAREAEAAVMRGDALGPLHGLPIGIKDMNDTEGLPTTFGSEIYARNIAQRDDALVAGLRAAGGLVLGKTNNPEWSAGANTRNKVYGATGNPYDPGKSCAGSSGGSAVALAAGMAPLATGSDLGGSLRNPAAYCGVVGFRPSPGIVPGEARGIALLPLSTSGPMARCVADAGLLLSVMARPDARDPYTNVMNGRTLWQPADFTAPPPRDLAALRFAVTEDFGFAPTEKLIRDTFRRCMSTLTPFLGRAEDASPRSDDADRIFATLRAVGFLGFHHGLMEQHPDKVGANVRANVEEGLALAALDVARALTDQGAYARRWQAFFDTQDYILSPAVTISPRDWHETYPTQIDGVATQSYYHWLGLAYASTLAGHPSITIPAGLDGAGMPFGLQIIGRRHDDAGVLAVAAALEAVIAGTSLAPRGPDIAALATARPIAEAPGFLDG